MVMAGMDKVRTAKVKELKEKIASGSYPLDSRKIAEAMLGKRNNIPERWKPDECNADYRNVFRHGH